MYELILYLKFYVKSEKTFQRSFKRLNVEKLVHNVLTFYRFNNLAPSMSLVCGGGHIFTGNRKPNRNFGFFGSSVWFRFLYLKSSIFGIVIGFHRIPNRYTKKPNYLTLSILKFGYSIM
jgi:hypothetical protein